MIQKVKEITGHSGAVYCCMVHGDFIYSGSADHYVTRWSIETGEQDKFAIKFEQSIYALEVINDSILVVGLSNGAIHMFDLNTREEIKYYTQHTKAVFELHLNPLKNQLFASDAEGNLSVWDTTNLELLIYLPFDSGKIRSIDSSLNGEFVALACQDGLIRVLETEFFNEIHTIKAHENGATAVMFHPLDESKLISGGKDALIKVWNWRTEEEMKRIPAHNFAVYGFGELTDVIVSVSRDKTIKTWSLNQLDFIERIDIKNGGHRHSVNGIAVIGDSKFVTCSDDGRLIVWSNSI